MTHVTVEEFNQAARKQLPLVEQLGFIVESLNQGNVWYVRYTRRISCGLAAPFPDPS